MTETRVRRRIVLPAVLLAGVVYVWGGYSARWTWTGLSGHVTLWDWLETLALPVTVGLLPLLLQHRRQLRARHKRVVLLAIAAFGALVVAGYLVPLRWTGFTGNTLWDWLELALLPVVLATASVWPVPEALGARHRTVIGVAAGLFLALVLAGYVVPLGWTGFTDNTAWDWLRLLLLPVLFPTLVLPALRRFLEARVVPAAADEDRSGLP